MPDFHNILIVWQMLGSKRIFYQVNHMRAEVKQELHTARPFKLKPGTRSGVALYIVLGNCQCVARLSY